MQKIRALIVGGDERRNIPKVVREAIDYVHVPSTRETFPTSVAPDVEVIVVLTRWLGRPAWRIAQDIAQKRKLPLIQSKTGNYILAGLIKHSNDKNKFKERVDPYLTEKAEEAVEAEEPKTEVQSPSQKDSPDDWTVEDLWANYGKRLIEVVKSLMLPDEKLDQVELFPILAEELSISEQALAKLIASDELKVKGVLANTVGTTWKRLAAGSDYKVDAEAAPKPPARKESQATKMTLFIAGLHPGPHLSKWAIAGELQKYKEFFTLDGKPPSRTYAMVMVKNAIELKIIKEVENQGWVIERDPSIQLTPINPQSTTTPEAPKKAEPKLVAKEEPKPAPAPEPKPSIVEKLSTEYVSLAGLAPALAQKAATPSSNGVPQSATVSAPEDSLKKVLGKIERCELMPDQLKLQKSLMPGRLWDAVAQQEICDRLKKAGLPSKPLPKGIFTSEEWDGLAWSALGDVPYRKIAIQMRGSLEDESCVCFECGTNFVFTKGEKQWLFEKFGDFRSPKYCKPCKNAKRNGNDIDAHIPTRWQ